MILGYYVPHKFPPDTSMANFIFFGICFGMAGVQPDHKTTLLLPVSRKGRYRAFILSSLIWTLVVVLIGGLILAASLLIDFLGHDITLFGHGFTYKPINGKSLFFFLLFLPVLYAFRLVITRYYLLPTIFLSLPAVILFEKTSQGFFELPAWGIAVLHLICWLPFIHLARVYCYSKDLAAKT
ncbi:MAG: hypothetical protein KJ645_05575 [Planctomycetes bacterium]|nr:hypothetical protein [Planctomycetota bacterium]